MAPTSTITVVTGVLLPGARILDPVDSTLIIGAQFPKDLLTKRETQPTQGSWYD